MQASGAGRPSHVIPWLKKVSIFQELGPDALGEISKITEVISFEPNQTVFLANEVADALYVIMSGQVRIEQNYRDGRRKTLAFLGPGHFFGEMAIVTDRRRCATAIISETAELMRVDKTAFLSSLKKNAELCFGILQVICERLRMADDEIHNLTFRNLPGRIVSKLFELGEQFGRATENGLLINLELTHYDLADMVGTNRESISKYLSKFKREGSVATHKKLLIIKDRRKLLSWT